MKFRSPPVVAGVVRLNTARHLTFSTSVKPNALYYMVMGAFVFCPVRRKNNTLPLFPMEKENGWSCPFL